MLQLKELCYHQHPLHLGTWYPMGIGNVTVWDTSQHFTWPKNPELVFFFRFFFFWSDVSSFSTKALLVKTGVTFTQCFTYWAICGQGASSEVLCWYPNQREFNQNRKAEVLMIRLVNELTRMAFSEWQNYHFFVTKCFCKCFKFKIISLLYFYRVFLQGDILYRLYLQTNSV